MRDINIFFREKPLKMICLGFSSGLPILLVFSTLSVWLVQAGINRSTVTLFSWAGFAYAFKYLWSPLVDNYKLPFGPIIDPSPGPTFEIEVAAPDNEVIKSSPVNESNVEITKKIIRYI